MNKKNFGESIIGIIISTFLLSFIILGITTIFINSKTTFDWYNEKKDINLLKNNTINILKNIDINSIAEDEEFYIYKNKISKQYEIFTGASNNIHMYVDALGNNINEIENDGSNIYLRKILLERNENIFGEKYNKYKLDITKYNEN